MLPMIPDNLEEQKAAHESLTLVNIDICLCQSDLHRSVT
jgi:hypothetical protein